MKWKKTRIAVGDDSKEGVSVGEIAECTQCGKNLFAVFRLPNPPGTFAQCWNCQEVYPLLVSALKVDQVVSL